MVSRQFHFNGFVANMLYFFYFYYFFSVGSICYPNFYYRAGFDNSHNQVGFLSVSVKQNKILSFLQPFAVRFAVIMAGFINEYKSINPQAAVNSIPTAAK